jgi:hypothetical protein
VTPTPSPTPRFTADAGGEEGSVSGSSVWTYVEAEENESIRRERLVLVFGRERRAAVW